MPVAIADLPRPSRSTETSMSVSLVVRLTDPRRRAAARAGFFTVSLRPRAIGKRVSVRIRALLSGVWRIRQDQPVALGRRERVDAQHRQRAPLAQGGFPF